LAQLAECRHCLKRWAHVAEIFRQDRCSNSDTNNYRKNDLDKPVGINLATLIGVVNITSMHLQRV